MKAGLIFFFNVKKYQPALIRKGGLINTITILTNCHTSGTTQRRADSWGVSTKSQRKKEQLSLNYLCVLFLHMNTKTAALRLYVMLSSQLRHGTSHLRFVFTPTHSCTKPVHLGEELVSIIIHGAQASWNLFGVSYSNQISTLIFQRLIGLSSGLFCQQGPRKKLISQVIQKVKRKTLQMP